MVKYVDILDLRGENWLYFIYEFSLGFQEVYSIYIKKKNFEFLFGLNIEYYQR